MTSRCHDIDEQVQVQMKIATEEKEESSVIDSDDDENKKHFFPPNMLEHLLFMAALHQKISNFLYVEMESYLKPIQAEILEQNPSWEMDENMYFIKPKTLNDSAHMTAVIYTGQGTGRPFIYIHLFMEYTVRAEMKVTALWFQRKASFHLLSRSEMRAVLVHREIYGNIPCIEVGCKMYYVSKLTSDAVKDMVMKFVSETNPGPLGLCADMIHCSVVSFLQMFP